MPHADLAYEQDYVDEAYERLTARQHERFANAQDSVAADSKAAAALKRELAAVKADLDSEQQLVFGRMDDATGEAMYVGRVGVKGEDGAPLVVSWKARAAAPFFQADAEDPMGLALRRRMLAHGRTLIDLHDEWFDELTEAVASGLYTPKDPPVLGQDALLIDLESRRDGVMRDIVATIQAEQYRAIRAPADGVVIIQGGPGTGKSAVGLHRAAFLLFDHEELRRDGVLVVGPNTAFMRYINKVLPSLGEDNVAQEAITRLGVVVEVRAEDSRKTIGVKGSVSMAPVLHRAVWSRPKAQALDIALPRFRVRLDEAAVQAILDSFLDTGSYDGTRRGFSNALRDAVAHDYVEGLRAETGMTDSGSDVELIARHEQFERALERVWPRLTAREVLRDLLSTRAQIQAHAEGLLEADEQALLLRTRARTMDSEPWTLHDLPLLHELDDLIQGTRQQFAHVIVDEAQDLSPMQLRMVGRHCSGSFTLLGDLAQATGPWSDRDWDTIGAQLDPAALVRLVELTIGYRVPTQVMAYAGRLLRFTAPDLTVPSSVRTWEEPELIVTDEGSLMSRAIDEAEAFASDDRSCALIVPDHFEAEASAHLVQRGVEFGNARDDDLSKSITLLPASLAKGLEFEGVVLLEPAAFKAWAEDGLRLLYVALTRTTQGLRIVHSKPLPPELAEVKAPPAGSVAERVLPTLRLISQPEPAPRVEEPAGGPLAVEAVSDETPLVSGLDEADLRLLSAVAEWLRARHS